MRAFALVGCLAMLVLAQPGDGYVDAELRLEVPKEVTFRNATGPGAETAAFRVTIAVKNKGKEKLRFSRDRLQFDVLDATGKKVRQPGAWSWEPLDQQPAEEHVIGPGATHKETVRFSFRTAMIRDGEKLTVVLHLCGEEEQATFLAKIR
jgi:hypothetical protein